ncbi:MAG TPA: hypothetical protein VGK67_11230 [Myxococcales bacterium]|jgi:hypothetical protein
MLLELTNREALELQQALHIYLEEMDFEVARTDRKEYREGLVIDRESLEGLKRRVDALLRLEEPDVVAESR